ncbi:hypothetical protein F4818DRAFT_76798 [Hypoxylon cercidicola]|nr:hypothetical protein F4818DRAFT_76798 [Hypoxylon cercidicola]
MRITTRKRASPSSKMDRLSPNDVRKPRRSTSSNRSLKSAHTSDSSEKGYSSSQRGDKSRPARKRASKPKVRTGCISCKRRHVKCDEGKPSCAECERLGLMCEGYAPPKTKAPTTRPGRLLLPKPKLSSLVAASSGTIAESSQPADYHLLVPPTPNFGFELNEEDKWYFALYRDQVADELSPYCPANFFSRTSLRDSMVSRCVHHSILSIGAYSRALMDLHNECPSGGKVSRTWWPPSVLNRHHQAALVHHAKALSYLRSNMRQYGIDGRVTMMATLLFIVFENMQGNYHSSGNLIRSGIKVLTNIRNKGSDPRSIVHRQWHRYLTTPRDEVDEMTDMFARHSVASAFVPFAHGKFAYHMLFTEDESDEVDFGLHSPFTFTVPQTLEQARQIWIYLMVQLADFLSKASWHNLHPDYDFDDAAAFREQAIFLALLGDLGVGLDALLFTAMDGRQTQVLELLRLHQAVAVVATSCCLDPTEMAYDDYLPQFEDVVRRCRFLFGAEASRVGFTNDAGRLPLLAFAGAKCRCARVRREVVELMRASDWREGSSDSSSLANAIAGLMKLEGQDGGDSGAVPEKERRYAWSNMFWDFEGRQMHVEYTKVLPDALGEFERVRYAMGV